MYIKNNNIDDFCTMITTCFLNGIKDIRVFVSENKYEQSEIITYVLFTPLYTAIYQDNVKQTIGDEIYHTLTECQDNLCNHEFRIQFFDKIIFDDKTNKLTVGQETVVV